MAGERVIIDFETGGVLARPDYPPIPAGVAIRLQGKTPQYLAWGHPSGNNCTRAEAKNVLVKALRHGVAVYHHAAFDIEVAMTHLGIPMPADFDDTLFLAYLNDPREASLGLKELCDYHLSMPPKERDVLRDWILENIKEAKKKPSEWGAYIAKAPGTLVAPYAKGDILRTEKLYHYMYARVSKAGMLDSYQREKRLLPIVLKMEQPGVHVDEKKLSRDLKVWEAKQKEVESGIKRQLRLSKTNEYKLFGEEGLNLNSPKQLADAMERAGKVTGWVLTEKGNRSTKRDALEKVCDDKKLLAYLTAFSVMDTYIGTFARPWLESAAKNDGLVFPRFNQTRSTEEGGARGTRTGRFSSDHPNFQNVPTDPMEKHDRLNLPQYGISLPVLRNYILPPPGYVFIGRDYSQQEFRLFAHYENGAFMARYQAQPWVDAHDMIGQLIYEATGIKFKRKYVKETGFGILYGMGLEKLAARLGLTIEEARKLKAEYLRAIPGIRTLQQELKKTAHRDEPIRTWGGRIYYCEPPKIIKGREWTFEYKLLNLLIQGGSADITKQAMIQVNEACNAKLVLQVHDELLAATKIGSEKREMLRMREAMEDIKLDVPMLSEGKKSSQSWGAMKDWEPDNRKKE